MRKQGLAGLSDDRSSEAWDKLYTFDTKQQQETKKERHTVHDGGFFASMAKLSASKPTLVEFTPEERRIVLEDLITHRAAVAIAEEDLEAPTPAAAVLPDPKPVCKASGRWHTMSDYATRFEKRIEARLKHTATPSSALIGSALGLGGLATADTLGSIAYDSDPSHVGPLDPQLLMLGSFAALSTLIFAAPNVPFARPRNTLGGHFVCVLIALAVHWTAEGISLSSTGSGIDGNVAARTAEKVLTPALGISAMLKLKLLHPPAAACGFIYTILPSSRLQGPQYLLMVMIACSWMLLVELFVAQVVVKALVALNGCTPRGKAK